MSKKIIAIFIVISIIVSFYSGLLHCFADYLIETDILKNEDSAIEQYNRLLQEFTNISGIIDYPNYYAGAYLNENGDLVICVTEDSESVLSQLQFITQNDDLKISKKATPYSCLEAIMSCIWTTYLEISEDVKHGNVLDENSLLLNDCFVGVGIKQETNSVVVQMNEISERTICAFESRIIRSSCVQFEHCFGAEEQNGNLKSGNIVRVSSGTGSVGFRAKMQITQDGVTRYAKGFFTARHVVDYVGQPVDYLSTDYSVVHNYVGTVIAGQYGNSVDAAFIEVPDYIIDEETREGVSLGSNYFTYIPEGATVTMCGAVSTNSLSGEIVNTSYNVSVSGHSLTDQYRCDYAGAEGDSGGVVYRYINGSNCIVGIHCGILSFWYGNDSYVTKASNIYSTWSLFQY